MIKKIYSVLDHKQRIRGILLLVLIFGGAMFETIGVSAVLPLVSAVTDPAIIDNNSRYRFVKELLHIKDYRMFILFMALALVFIYIIKNIYLVLMTNAQNHYTTNNQRRLSVRLMKCYMNQEYLFHVEHNIAELERNVNSDIESFINVLNAIFLLATELLVCGMLGIFLMITDFFTTILMIALMVLFLLLFMKVFRKKLRGYGEQTREYSAARNKYFLESFGGIKEIKASSKENYFVDKYDTAYRNFAIAAQGQMLLNYIPRPIMESLCIGGLLLFMSIRIALGTDVSRFIPVMSVFAVAAIRLLPSFNRISGYLGVLMFNKAAVDAVCKDIIEMEQLNKKNSFKEDLLTIKEGDIVVDNLTFAYPTHPDKKIINNVNFSIPINKSVAFVGPSGAGKTTLADIILGVLKPESGTISVGKINVIEHPTSWHKNIGYIPQSIFLTDDTIRANVAFGIPDSEIDDEKVWKSLEEAQIADFVRNQEDGIYSNIGDRGVKISGGQRQRIGIARALYCNPSVIVLDEATSALDNDTEKAVMDAIYNLAGKKTMIIIAHRLTTISKCDVIYEVNEGEVSEVKYQDLIK